MGKAASALQTAIGFVMLAIPGPWQIYGAFLVVGGFMGLAGALSEKSPALQGRGHLVNTRSTQEPIPLIYGRCRVGINQAYAGCSGEDNKYLHIIGIVGEGPLHGIAQTDGVDQVFLDDKLYTAYGSLVYYEFFTGTDDQAVCATLAAADPTWNDPLRHTAYLYIRLRWNADKFQGLPNITIEVEGQELYDPRDETTGYSTNPALAVRDFLARSSRRGGLGIASARIDDDAIGGAASYCEAKDWTVGIPLTQNRPAVDNLRDILACFRGAVVYAAGSFRLKYLDLDYESSVMSLTEDDVALAGDASSLRIRQPSLFDAPNAVRCKYLNAEKRYQTDDFVLSDAAAVAADGDLREETVTLTGVNASANVQKLANYWLERLRHNRTAEFAAGSRCLALEPLDLVDLTHSLTGWDGQIMRVQGVSVQPDGAVGLSLLEENAAFYDDDYDDIAHVWYETTLPDPSGAVRGVHNVSQAEEVYSYRGRSFTRWTVDFDPPDPEDYPWWDHAEIWLAIGAGGWKFMTKAASDYQLDPVEEGVTYYLKIQSVSIHGAREAFEDAYTVSHTIVGKTDAPADIDSLTAVASNDVVNLYADPVADPDVVGYEVRLGANWSGGLFIGFNETPNIRLAGVRPGTHTFWMAAKDNAGNYSANPESATVTVFYPALYSEKNSWAWDFTTGDHSNTEHTTYNGTDACKCSHTGGVLAGTWTSPVYDLGSKKKVRCWGDFLTAMADASLTWDGLIPSGDTWDTRIPAGMTWAEFFSTGAAGRIEATISWGDAVDDLPNAAGYFHILAPEIDGRYVQVAVTITDPAAGANLYLYELNMEAYFWE